MYICPDMHDIIILRMISYEEFCGEISFGSNVSKKYPNGCKKFLKWDHSLCIIWTERKKNDLNNVYSWFISIVLNILHLGLIINREGDSSD